MIATQLPAPALAPTAPETANSAPAAAAGGAVTSAWPAAGRPLLQRCAACGKPQVGAGSGAGGGNGSSCNCASSAPAKAPDIDRNDPLGRMLARAVAQRAEAGAGTDAAATTQTPHYKYSESEAPGVRDPDKALEAARQLAIGYVEAARQALRETIAGVPEDGLLYTEAITRHFLSATPDEQKAILGAYDRIADTLKVDNYVVTRGRFAVKGEDPPCKDVLAYWNKVNDLVYLCPMFWQLSPFCRAITLIHEGAHDADVDRHMKGHQSGRGGVMYPKAGAEGIDGVTTADRHANPDVYAFFAAHIAAGADHAQTCGRPKGKGK